ncbi:glycosyltransferase family 4 protein [Actinotalea solisilvae]|uniref:glycosyltransferase family 4 protein n=1 Tax=Actinotalea solisilvae TaxID=2072922 RepID=UPI0018F243EB|nr:glycosyltransferase family 1 protein [Actinotalea solisilvae]
MRVALTAEQLWQPVPGGSGTYVVELGAALAATGVAEVTGVAARHAGPPAGDWAPPFPVRHARLPRPALYEAWNRLGRPRAESLVPGADVVHAATWAVPPTRRPLVVTVHDVAFLHDASHFTPRGNAFFRRSLERVRAEADAVVVPSQATADDCVAVGLPAGDVHVVPHGATVPDVRPDEVTALRERFGLERPYVLWCGTLEPRKNVPALLRAFAEARRGDVDLVLVGPSGWGDQAGAAGAAQADPRVRLLGPVDRRTLHAAYAGALAFCFPSLREGFGLPVLEAMSHGVPVVTSAGTACAEVAGDAALLADPRDADALARALREACGPSHDDLAAASVERARAFSWPEAARRTAEVYASVTR